MFRLVGVVSTLTCEKCIKKIKNRGDTQGLISQPSALAHAPAGRNSIRFGEKKKTTELAELEDLNRSSKANCRQLTGLKLGINHY